MQFRLKVIGHVDEMDKRIKQSGNPTSEMQSILNLPIKDLEKPLAVNSSILNETIFLCANEEMARQVEARGGTAYTPEEIAALLRVSKKMGQGEWAAFLMSLHMAKKTFKGSRIQAQG